MGGDIKKQYMEVGGRPAICYPLSVFEKSRVDEIVLVVTTGDEEYVRAEIVERYGFKKVTSIVAGGRERYDSVRKGIEAADGKYVLIHDGARVCVTEDIIERAITAVTEYGACVVGMPSKDTVKISNGEGYVSFTPSRDTVWNVQTPQCFVREELIGAYEKLSDMEGGFFDITDDAMIMERTGERKIRLIEGSYENIKLTTPEDISVVTEILKKNDKYDKM